MNILGKINPSKPITIIGGGISGLSLGLYLKKMNLQYSIIETKNQTGGKVGTHQHSLGIVEKGPNALLLTNKTKILLQELNLNPIFPKKNLKRWVYYNKKCYSSKSLLIKLLFPFITHFFFQINFKKNWQSISIESFLKPFYNEEKMHIIKAILSGIYGGDLKDFSLGAILPDNLPPTFIKKHFLGIFMIKMILHIKKNSADIFGSCSFKYGMEELVSALKKTQNKNIQLNQNFEPLNSETQNIIICTSAIEAAELLKKKSTYISHELKKISYQSLYSTTIFSDKKIDRLDKSFGMLFAQNSNMGCLGILANSEIFEGRTTGPHIHSYTLIHIVENIDQVFSILHLNVENIKYRETTFWQNALPVYNTALFGAINNIKDYMKENPDEQIGLFGNYLGSIGLKNLLTPEIIFK